MSSHPMFFCCCQESFTPSDFKTLKVSFLTWEASQDSRLTAVNHEGLEKKTWLFNRKILDHAPCDARKTGRKKTHKTHLVNLQTLDIYMLRRISANRFGDPPHNKKTLKDRKNTAVVDLGIIYPLLIFQGNV